MKMAKPSERDMTAALDMVRALECLLSYGELPGHDSGPLDLDDPRDALLALRTLLGIAGSGSLGRVVLGMATVLHPRNEVVDPDSDVLELHPKHRPPAARPLAEWHEDDGPVVWWRFPVEEPAWIGTPLDEDWPGDHTHWTPHPAAPKEPTA